MSPAGWTEHQLEKIEKGYRCTICGWTWQRRTQSMCPGILRFDREKMPAHYLSRYDLHREGLAAVGEPVGCYILKTKKPTIVLLYDGEAARRAAEEANQAPAKHQGRAGRIKGWSKMSGGELWEHWLAQFEGEAEAIASAVWMGNRLVKGKAPSTRRAFYDLKDEFILVNQANLVTGRRVREEQDECYACEGVGKLEGRRCGRCRGTGVYRKRTLYVHELDIGGQRYSFHSYQKPERLAEEPGENLEHYGGRFSEEELDALALPMSGLLRVLGYVATLRWGLVRRGGRYVGEWG